MTRSEADIAIGWAAAEGWNPGLHDGDCFYQADPTGFLIGLVRDEPVATLSAVRYGESFGFIGFYIVKPECRGRGYGLQIWQAGLAHLGDRTVGLDGVVAQQENYQRSGFALAHQNRRYQGTGGGVFPVDLGVVPLSVMPFEPVNAYDRRFFPGERGAFLRCWINQPDCTALGVVRDDALMGYGVVRQCRSGYKIGPLFADTPEVADCLFSALRSQVPVDEPLVLDIPAVNPAAVELADRYGMTMVFETARMYIGPAPVLPMDRLFGITTFELG
ncbi:MAG: GNAT family N-acetyltransferase [Elainellaceae cyanobacterium]